MLTWNPEGKQKRGRSNNTLSRGSESEMKRIKSNWKQMESVVQKTVRWRIVIGGLWSSRRGDMR